MDTGKLRYILFPVSTDSIIPKHEIIVVLHHNIPENVITREIAVMIITIVAALNFVKTENKRSNGNDWRYN